MLATFAALSPDDFWYLALVAYVVIFGLIACYPRKPDCTPDNIRDLLEPEEVLDLLAEAQEHVLKEEVK